MTDDALELERRVRDLEAENERLKLVLATKGSMHDANTCTCCGKAERRVAELEAAVRDTATYLESDAIRLRALVEKP